ncbi:MAG: hypothetical protein LUF04_16460, partial [Bacteroides sp.]|nr:hypothetical protein [Bacteroides sp.]
MNKNILASLLIALLVLSGCDYNDKYFKELDDIEITDVVHYDGLFTGEYPDEGYFTDRESLEKAVVDMLKGMFPYADAGSTANVSPVLYGEVIPGFETTDVKYELTDDDYDAMGEESGQPGKYNNFDANMDVDAYLTEFLNDNYSDLEVGKTISITYKYYANSTTTNQTNSYERTSAGWEKIEVSVYTPTMSYTLETEDYQSMGTASGEPGRYNNFDSNMDVDHYLTVFLKQKFPYATEGTTCEVTYVYYSGGTSDRSSLYKYNGSSWEVYDPYEDTIEITERDAVMAFDGSNWSLVRLMGGTEAVLFTTAEYQLLVDWVIANEPEYVSTVRPEQEEYYFGASSNYNNINNAYSTWKNYYNVGGYMDGLTNDEISDIMEERLAWGIANVVLPVVYPEPNPELTYAVHYVL